MTDTAEARIEIQDELKESYLNYAMSVIVSRALPDVRDGLKPSQRRILAAMNDLGLTPQSKTRKCAKICGDTSGNYHPHGEQVIYPTLVRMAQEFTIRYPLIIGQGNFGSIDGDPPAQMRYTEAKLSAASTELLDDINEDTVDMVPNYDETRQEPTVLPSRFPNLLVNGATGIAVGMSTSIPQHNIIEICDALLILLQKPEAGYDDIFRVFDGPDFPTGGIIYNKSQLRKAYEEGKGIIRIRGKVGREEAKTGISLIISEIPYGITKADLIKDLVEHVNEGKINGISDIRDESDKKGVRIVLTLTKGSDPDMLTHILYKQTRLELSFSMNFIVLKDKTPTLLSLKELLEEFLTHRSNVIIRRSKFRLGKAENELHIKEGILKALDVIDEIIDIIRHSREQSEAKQKLIERFKFSEKQVEAILKITLARLTRLEKETLAREIEALKLTIKELKEILESREKLKDVIRKEIEGLKPKFKGERKTAITDDEFTEDIDIPVESKEVLVIISKKGFCKRIYTEALGTRKSFSIQETRGQDEVTVCATTFTDQLMLAFSNKGQAYGFPVHRLPVSDKSGRGKNIHQLISLGDHEYISDIVTLPKLEGEIIFITAKGNMKKTPASEFINAKKAGIKAINIKDDELVRALTETKNSIIVINSDSSMLRFNLKDIRIMGRQGAGVRGMKIKPGNKVTDAILVDDKGAIILSNPNSSSKKIPLDEIREQSRGGKGIASGGATKACFTGKDSEKVVYITTSGQYNQVSVKSIPKMGRSAKGKKMVKSASGQISRII